jgi:hypothetical protein
MLNSPVGYLASAFILSGFLHANPVAHLPLREGISCPLPDEPTQPVLTLEVAPNGSDSGDGSHDKPFATLNRCWKAIRAAHPLAAGGILVIVHGGLYPVTHPLVLNSDDSGEPGSPIIVMAAPGEQPVFTGGKRLTGWRKLNEKDGESLVPKEARPHIIVADLTSNGITSILPLKLGGFASGIGFVTHPAHELFYNDRAMQLARSPNSGWMISTGSKGAGTVLSKEELPAVWKKEPDLRFYGYWHNGWADSYEQPVSIDPAQHLISFTKPWSKYGYRENAKYFAINVMSALETPGEWYLDRTAKKVLLYPPVDATNTSTTNVMMSTLTVPMIQANGLHDVTWEGLTWDLGAADGLQFENCDRVAFKGCTISRFAGDGLQISGLHNSVLSCNIFSMGRGGIVMEGGDRSSLKQSGNSVINCDIHDLSRIDHTYTPALLIRGVGARILHNRLHDILSSAMRVDGNDHLILNNEIYSVCSESDDQGGSDSFGDPTFRGNVFRSNYWHHIGDWQKTPPYPRMGRAGIRLDNAISGFQIDHNIFERCSDAHFGGVQINGGKDNVIENNLFIDCDKGVSMHLWRPDIWKRNAEEMVKGLDLPLYEQHYPAMKDLFLFPGKNIVRKNACLRCPEFIDLSAGDQLVSSENAVKLPENFSVSKAQSQIAVPGLDPISLGQIGLFRDSWRTSDPEPAEKNQDKSLERPTAKKIL